MPGRHRKTFRHPIFEMYLLMASNATDTGMTDAEARDTLKQLVPSMAEDVDTIVDELGEGSFIPSRVMDATFEVLNREERSALRQQIAKAIGGHAELEDVAPTSQPNGSFSDRLRRELNAKRDASGRVTVEV